MGFRFGRFEKGFILVRVHCTILKRIQHNVNTTLLESCRASTPQAHSTSSINYLCLKPHSRDRERTVFLFLAEMLLHQLHRHSTSSMLFVHYMSMYTTEYYGCGRTLIVGEA